MQQLSFSRRNYSQLVVSISADEPLADLGGGYIEDYYGTISQITLHNTDTDTRYDVLITDNNPTFLEGYVNLNSLPDGLYNFEGLITDTVGHNTIIGELQNTSLTGQELSVVLTIHPALELGVALSTSFPTSGLTFTFKLIQEIPVNDTIQLTSPWMQTVQLNETVNIDMSLIVPTFHFQTELFHNLDSIL